MVVKMIRGKEGKVKKNDGVGNARKGIRRKINGGKDEY